jgi:glycosyltransferase involved in cell wall biosynthesis
MTNQIKYSFIIPVKEVNDYIRESVPKILEIAREDFEVIIYPDHGLETTETWSKTKQIASGRGPAVKRNLAVRDARGDFLIFIDDDAYPRKDILDILDSDFADENIAAIGGPAITPGSDSFLQKVSGAVFLSHFSGGFPERYVPVGKKRYVNDWPTVNLTVRKSAFLKAGGFDCNFWPGEDTKFCLDVINKLKEKNKILYDPEVIVWHHRREGIFRHLKQVGSYGIHRGFFAKKYPKTSFRPRYFVPSFFFLFVFGGLLLSHFFVFFEVFYLLGWIAYGLAMLVALFDITRRQKNFPIALFALVYVFLTHLVYGARFLQGFFFKKELKSKMR